MIPTRVKLSLAESRLGCVLLHLACIVRGGRPDWHMQYIKRELRPMLRARMLVLGLLIATSPAWHIADAASYGEPYRPQFHFTPERNWMNDPNGMVYFDGEYHLFYQYNPFGDKWGHMSWGHTVSKDMLHWKHLPVALAEEDGIMIFSGSAVIDWKNTSGFGVNNKPPMVAIYTGRRNSDDLQNQCIAFSNDKGRTWTKYKGNPVIDIGSKNFRDPKVFWHEDSQSWVMVVALSDQRKVRFYRSPDLKDWKQAGEFGPAGSVKGIWECPDLFPLRVEGANDTKWVLIVNIGGGAPSGGSGTQYFVGAFDGSKFTAHGAAIEKKSPAEPTGKVFADFEHASYGDWKADGEAFGSGPARGTLPNQMAVSGFRGASLVNSYTKGDATQGTLTSPPFTINSSYINFLVGGGAHVGRTCVNLVVDGKIIRSATGSESEALDWHAWPVADLKGKTARIEIVDKESGGWGHVNVDQIIFSDAPAFPTVEDALWADYGCDFYAGVSWSDVPSADGRRLWLGWMSNWQYAQDVPTSPWRSAMSLPRELSLIKKAGGYRLRQVPVKELATLRSGSAKFSGDTVAEANAWLKKERVSGKAMEIIAEFETKSSASFGLKLLKTGAEQTVLSVVPSRSCLVLDRSASGNTSFHPKFAGLQQAPLTATDKVRLHIFVDWSSIEVFAEDGTVVITSLAFPTGDDSEIEFFGPAGALRVSAEARQLKSVWNQK